jgi:hypothetical protein
VRYAGVARIVSLGALAAWVAAAAHAATYTTFDPAGSIFTRPSSINDAGVITGFYGKSLFVFHGFIRAADGTITSFEAGRGGSTVPVGIDGQGRIYGSFTNKHLSATYGFVRQADGTITRFHPEHSKSTRVTAMDAAAGATGYYRNDQGDIGFLLSLDGRLTKFSAPGSSRTYPMAINSNGVIAGEYVDGDAHGHCFLRTPDGQFTSFDPPRSLSWSDALTINADGVIAGNYKNVRNVIQGFVRDTDGAIATFHARQSTETTPLAINGSGTIAGYYYYTADPWVQHGFLRNADGSLENIDDPDASSDTFPVGINGAGTIIGNFTDASGVTHGFIRTE